MVGAAGFEPATPWSQTRCSTKLSYFPLNAPSRSRTYNLLIRSQTLYPVALWVQIMIMPRNFSTKHTLGTVLGKRKTGFEPATPTMARWCSTTELLPHTARRLPTLARGVPLTTLGVTKLNFCVRNGNRCILRAIITALFT